MDQCAVSGSVRSSQAASVIHVLRVADPRSGARLCEPQHARTSRRQCLFQTPPAWRNCCRSQTRGPNAGRYFLAITATFIDAGNECAVGGLKPACAKMSEYSAKV